MGRRRSGVTDHAVPGAFPGHPCAGDIPLDEVFELLDRRLSPTWGGRGSGPSTSAWCGEFEPALERLKREAVAEAGCTEGVARLFPDVIAATSSWYEPSNARDGTSSRGRDSTSRGRKGAATVHRGLLPRVVGGDVDVVAFQIVTVGDEATRRFERQQAAGEYSEAFYQHGLAVESAEDVAEWMHRRIRRELGIPGGRGKRYSWGYGACPDLEDHAQLFRLLPAEEALGMELTSAFQLIPEQSTAAVIVHHPQAKYYAYVRSGGAGPTIAFPHSHFPAFRSPAALKSRPRPLLTSRRSRIVVLFDGAMGMLYAKGVPHQPVLRRVERARARPVMQRRGT